MGDYFDNLEIRSADQRESEQLSQLKAQVNLVKLRPYYQHTLANFESSQLNSLTDLAQLPITRKSDLPDIQAGLKPFGGLTTRNPQEFARLFVSPGPISEPEGFGKDWWRFGRALFAAGFRQGDIVQNCGSYHFTPMGFIMESAAQALGVAVIPTGPGQTERQVQAMAHYQATGYAGTPDYLQTILLKAEELKVSLPQLKYGLVSAGPYLPSHRQFYQERNLQVVQAYGTADLGLVAYESPGVNGLILDEQVIVEIVRPGSNQPVAFGDVGEVVVTSLNPDYPLIRFAVGDLSKFIPGTSDCGRTSPRIQGWMGRADQSAKVKGMFVYPKHIAAVVDSLKSVTKGRLIVSRLDGKDTLKLLLEAPDVLTTEALERATEIFQQQCHLRTQVGWVEPDSLANDGLVIEDNRELEPTN